MRKADNLPPSCAVVMKSGELNFLEPSGPVTGLLYLYPGSIIDLEVGYPEIAAF